MYKVLGSLALASFSYFTTVADGAYYAATRVASLEFIILGRIPFTNVKLQFDYMFIPMIITLAIWSSIKLFNFGKDMIEDLIWGPESVDYLTLISI